MRLLPPCLPGIFGLAALLGTAQLASAGSAVCAGGTYSANDVPGYHDMSKLDNTQGYLNLFGNLYIHPNGWAPTSAADKASVKSHFPAAAMFETTFINQTAASTKDYYNAGVKSYYSTVGTLTVNITPNSTGLSTMDMNALKTTWSGVAGQIAIICGPNYDNTTAGAHLFNSAWWAPLRANGVSGGALCMDSPPQYYFDREQAYRTWITDAIKWANGAGVVSIAMVYPRDSVDYYGDLKSYLASVNAAGAHPASWAFDGYYSPGNPDRLNHPLGSELSQQHIMYSARRMRDHERNGVAF